jgi:hypothetical protein
MSRTFVAGIAVATALGVGACGDGPDEVKLDKQGQELMKQGQQLKKDAQQLENQVEQIPTPPPGLKDLPGQEK